MCETIYKLSDSGAAEQCCFSAAREAHTTACTKLYEDNPGRAPTSCASAPKERCRGVSSAEAGTYEIVYSAMDRSCVCSLSSMLLLRSLARA